MRSQRLIKFLFLLNGLTFTLATMCPFIGLDPNTKISTPKVLMPIEFTDWPSTTKEISIVGTVEFDDDCAAGQTFTIFSLTVNPGTETEIINYSLNCDTLKITGSGEWADSPHESDAMYPTTLIGPISFMVTISLDAKFWKGEVQTSQNQKLFSRSSSITAAYSFDSLTIFRPCAGKAAAGAKACTVNNLYFFDEYFTENYPAGYASMRTPTLFSFHTLMNGPSTVLKPSYGFSNGFFGDKASNPTAGTSPKWDSKNEYIEITDKGQFLSFTTPGMQPSVQTTTKTISISAWLKISSVPGTTATIFSINKSDGTELPLKLQIDQSGQLQLVVGTQTLYGPTATLNTWHLIGFVASERSNEKGVTGSIFVDSTVNPVYTTQSLNTVDLSGETWIRIGSPGASFLGTVFGLRLVSPGGGFIPQSICSADNALELGLGGTFPLICATGLKLYPKENKCYQTCPSGTEELTTTPHAICAEPSSSSGSGSGSGSTSSSAKGLSAGLVVAIVLSSTAVLVLVLLSLRHAYKDDKCCIAFFGAFGRKRKDQEKVYMQAAISPPISPIATEGPVETEGPGATESP